MEVEDDQQALPQVPSRINLQIITDEEQIDGKILIKNQKIKFDGKGNLLLANLLQRVNDLGMNLNSNQLVSYFSDLDEIYTMAGRFPISPD